MLEEDSLPALDAGDDGWSGSGSVSRNTLQTFPSIREGGQSVVFFKPVDNNMAHLTFLGSGMQKSFDFVAQLFSIRSHKMSEEHILTEVSLGLAHGPPMAMTLSDLSYDILSKKLMIWSSGKLGYHVLPRKEMFHGDDDTLQHFEFWESGWVKSSLCKKTMNSFVRDFLSIQNSMDPFPFPVIQPDIPRPMEASDLMVCMAAAGAFPGTLSGFYVDPEKEIHELDFLMNKNLVRGFSKIRGRLCFLRQHRQSPHMNRTLTISDIIYM